MSELIPMHDHAIAQGRADGRQSLAWRGVVTLLSSLSHGAGSQGNIQMFNTEKIISGGRVIRVPYVTGNAMKHRVIRRPGIDFMLRYLGLENSLTRSCLQLLYSGGFLSAKGASVDLGQFIDLAEQIPLLGLLGGSLGNVIQESRIQSDSAVLFCAENQHRLPDCVDKSNLPKMSSCRDVVGYSRGDATKQAPKQIMMTETERDTVIGRVVNDKLGRTMGVAPAKAEKNQSTQMRYETEVVVPGAQFWWEIRLHDASPVETGAFFSALLEFGRAPYIGGKSSIGHGKIKVNFDNWSVDPLSQTHANEIAIPGLDAYQAHLDEQRKDVCKALKGIK